MITRRFQILVYVILLLVLTVAAQAESLADYHRLLNTISQQLDQAKQLEQAKPGSGVPIIKKLWNDCPASICVPSGGRSVDTDLGWVRDELYGLQHGKDTNRVTRITSFQERISMLSAASSPQPGMGSASARDAKRTLHKVLEDNEYKPSWLDKLRQKINEIILAALRKLDVSPGAANVIGKIVMAIAVILFVIALIYLILYFVRVYTGTPTRGKAQKVQVKSTRRPTPESVIQAAERDAAAGRHREAFRGVYLASILLLDRAKLIKYTEGVTNYEYLRALKRAESPEPATVFSEMTSQFDLFIYGDRAVSSGDYNDTLKHYRRLEGLL